MARGYQLIVPTILETQVTGFLGAMEKTYRGNAYRVEFHAAGMAPTKNGEKLRKWDDVPLAIQKAAIAARDMLQQPKGV